MKKKIAIVLSVLTVLLAVVFAGCAEGKLLTADNQNNTPAAENTSFKIADVSLDSAIDIALKDASVQREAAVFRITPSLDNDEENQHYDIEFVNNGVEYSYEVAVKDGEIIKAEKEKTVEEREKTEKDKSEKPTEAPTKTPETQKKEYISVEQAKELALRDAGKKADEVEFKKAYYDADDLVAHFEINFVADGYEYEYEIKAVDGKVLEKDIDKVERQSSPTAVEEASAEEYISKDKALAIALSHAKLEASQLKFSKVELDRNDLIAHYEVEFISGSYEYDYEINAKSGKIIAYDKEIND